MKKRCKSTISKIRGGVLSPMKWAPGALGGVVFLRLESGADDLPPHPQAAWRQQDLAWWSGAEWVNI